MFQLLLLALVVGMGTTVLAYASRSLRDEPYRRRFTVIGGMLIVAGGVLVVTSNLIVIAAAWIATSLLAVSLIRTGPDVGVADRSLRARRSFALGDLALLAAVCILVVASGSTAVADIDQAGAGPLAVSGVLLVVAAAARSASGPFFRWLPDSLGAPTPSSALLHAGVVNGGALLLIKLAPATTESLPGALAAVLIGGLTCVFAEAVMLTRPDVKGRLAWSTIAQMSFTMVLCGLGLHIAAGLHLVAHGFYKGALFLGSGSTVRGIVRQRTARLGDARRHLGAFAVTGLALAGTLWVTATPIDANLAVPAALGWIAAGCAMQAWMRRAVGVRARLVGAAAGVSSLVAYVLLTLVLKAGVRGELEVAEAALSPAWVLPVLVALVVVALAPRNLGIWERIRAAGRPTAAPRLVLPGPFAWRPEHVSIAPHRPALDHIGVLP